MPDRVRGRRVSVAFLGPIGTLSQEAVEIYVSRQGGVAWSLLPMGNLADTLWAVQEKEADVGVVPAENSIEGSVHQTWDLLLHELDLTIIGEVILPIRHHLLVQPGVKREQVSGIISHPQALAQCRSYLRREFPGVKTYETVSTAEAARLVAVNELPMAAIGSRRSAQLYGLEVLAEDIQDYPTNATRFLAVALPGAFPVLPPTGRDRTSLVCGLEKDRPGALFHLLRPFAEKGLNLSRIESRPTRRQLGDYVFFIDVEGHQLDPALAEVLEQLRREGSLLKVLGSYPKG